MNTVPKINKDKGTFSEKETGNGLLFEARSPEMQEIIGGMPSWITRWGVITICVFAIILFTGAYFVKYPDIKRINLTIAYSNPLLIIKSKGNAPISKLYVKDKQKVKQGQLLMVLESGTKFDDCILLKDMLNRIDSSIDIRKAIAAYSIDSKFQLGKLQPLYQDLLILISDYKNNKFKDRIRDAEQLQAIRNNVKQIIAEIKKWEDQYLIYSSIEGSVSFLKDIKQDYFVTSEEAILAILPPFKKDPFITGRAMTNEISKIQIGQKVIIQLEGFPYQQYGFLKGSVSHISKIKVNNEYLINIKLLNGLITTNNYEIPLQNQFDGIGEIVIEDRSALQRIISSKKD